jgi:hypothetical protein
MLKLILIESGTSHGIKQFYIIDISINLYRRETMAKRKSIFRRIKEAFVNFFGNIRFYKGGVILFGDSKYKLKGTDWRSILDSLQPGDIVGSAHNNYVSAWFIKGDFGHVGVYVGDNRIIHVRTDGIANEDILTFLRACNSDGEDFEIYSYAYIFFGSTFFDWNCQISSLSCFLFRPQKFRKMKQ